VVLAFVGWSLRIEGSQNDELCHVYRAITHVVGYYFLLVLLVLCSLHRPLGGVKIGCKSLKRDMKYPNPAWGISIPITPFPAFLQH
jgi:hypothetical protein